MLERPNRPKEKELCRVVTVEERVIIFLIVTLLKPSHRKVNPKGKYHLIKPRPDRQKVIYKCLTRGSVHVPGVPSDNFPFLPVFLHHTLSSNLFPKISRNNHYDHSLSTYSLPPPFHYGKKRLLTPLMLGWNTWLASASGISADATGAEALRVLVGWLCLCQWSTMSTPPGDRLLIQCGPLTKHTWDRPELIIRNLEPSSICPQSEAKPLSWA